MKKSTAELNMSSRTPLFTKSFNLFVQRFFGFNHRFFIRLCFNSTLKTNLCEHLRQLFEDKAPVSHAWTRPLVVIPAHPVEPTPLSFPSTSTTIDSTQTAPAAVPP